MTRSVLESGMLMLVSCHFEACEARRFRSCRSYNISLPACGLRIVVDVLYVDTNDNEDEDGGGCGGREVQDDSRRREEANVHVSV